MKTLFLDIETIPADEEQRETLAYLYERKQEKKRKKAQGEGAAVAAAADTQDFEQFLLSTSFDGAFGRILTIGYAIDDGPLKALSGDEHEILVQFWEIARDVDLFVGHNVMEFDLPFIFQVT